MSDSYFEHDDHEVIVSQKAIAQRKALMRQYVRRIRDMWDDASRDETTGHVGLGDDRWRVGFRLTYELSRDPVRALCHWRIAARRNDSEAMQRLKSRGADDFGARDIPHAGKVPHPDTNRLYDLLRTSWFDADVMPVRPGLYELARGDGIVYAIWDGSSWSSWRDNLGQLLDEDIVRTVWISKALEPLRWRGLAACPNPAHSAYWPLRHHLKPDVRIEGYILQRDALPGGMPMMHLAAADESGGTTIVGICGYRPSAEKPALWNAGLKLKVLYGEPQPLCRRCERMACDIQQDNAMEAHVADVGHVNPDCVPTARVLEASESAPKHKEQLLTPQVRYHGAIEFRDQSITPVETFEIINDGNVYIEIYGEPHGSKIASSYVLRCTARRRSDGHFETAYIPLRAANGELYGTIRAMLSFRMQFHDEMLHVHGAWFDDNRGNVYKFSATLLRKLEESAPIP